MSYPSLMLYTDKDYIEIVGTGGNVVEVPLSELDNLISQLTAVHQELAFLKDITNENR